ncbi:hypothetical protein KKB18_02920, partial [bacterium]|nr:hypothetical protein [bacterium]
MKKDNGKEKQKQEISHSNTSNYIITGSAGEFFVSAEIARRGAVATLTLKNTPSVDILATNLKNGTFANIQVKTRSLQNKQGWKLNYKVEEKSNIKNHFYVFVKLKGENDLPDYYVITHNEFADFQKDKHQRWLLMKNTKGGEHKDNKIR